MRRITLVIILLFAATCADAAWYQKTDGTIVDPIQHIGGFDHSYHGNNLESSADLIGAYLNYAVLFEADLSYAYLYYAELFNADLRYADLSEANLGNAYLERADLMNADLRWADLSEATLTNADLTGADLYNADLFDADLSSADLSGADLVGARLGFADLTGADLTGADLTGANLRYADLEGADLTGSDFSNVYLYDYHTTWTDAFYYTDNEPTWRSGMDAAWRTSVGILALAPTNAVPEPSTLLLALIGLALVPRKRRR